jgi:signal transduction histidine kinase
MRGASERMASVAFALAIALLILNGVLFYRNTVAVAAREQRVAHSREVLDVLQTILSTLSDAETGQRGYLITGEPRYLEPYNQSKDQVNGQIERLETLAADNRSIQRQIPLLEKNVSAAFYTMKEAIAVRDADGFEAAQRLVLTDQGKKQMDGIRQLIAGIKQAEEDVLERRTEVSRLTMQTALGVLCAATSFSVAWLGLCFYLVRQHLRLRKDAEESLRKADQHKNEFLAVLGHELRNPLASLRNAVEIVRLRPAEASTLLPALDLMERQVKQMNRLVEDLMDISRISQGKIELRKAPLDLVVAAQSAVQSSRPLIAGRRHELTLSLPAEPLWVEADPARLAQILTNLINNAAKYTEEGGHIWLTVERAGREAVVRVRDTGVGIPAEMLPRVFDLFVQGNGSMEHAQGGLGIGLNLVRRLVELHGGRVEARSEGPGRGSEFSVRLPALPDTKSYQSANGWIRARPVQAGEKG